MTVMLWVKMPSEWVSVGKLKSDFSGNKISEDIAALKLYLVICLLAKEVTRTIPIPDYLSLLPKGKLTTQDVLECSATYDTFTEMCSLSRALVSKGLRKLKSTGLISVEGGYRSKKYIVSGSSKRRWCKLPKRALVHNEEKIPMFLEFLNRSANERSALKIYIYILASRTNSKRYVDLTRGTISSRTGVPILQIDGALGFLQSIGMMEKVETRNSLLKGDEAIAESRLHRYWVKGNEGLYYRSQMVVAEDYEKPTGSLYV